MIKKFTQLQKQSHLTRGGLLVAMGLLAALGILTLAVKMEPAWLRWFISLASFSVLGVLGFWKAAPTQTDSTEELVEVARKAIQTEAARLDGKRLELERVLMAYGEWMEFPDYKNLREIRWEGGDDGLDRRVGELIDQKSDALLTAFSSGKLWVDGKFQMREMLMDLFDFVEQIARLYKPDAERPLLETNLEALLKAVNRASLQIILMLEEIPMLELKGMNLSKATERIEIASKVYKTYEDLKPWLDNIRYLWQGSKFVFFSNPLVAAGSITVSEILWKEGKKMGKKAIDAYLLSMVRQSLGIIAWETAGIYDRNYRYRNPDWIYGVELAHFASVFEPTAELLREVLKELGKLPLRSAYDRLFLFRCVANHCSSRPDEFSVKDWLPPKAAPEIEAKLTNFAERVLSKEIRDGKPYHKWRAAMIERIGSEVRHETLALPEKGLKSP